MQHPVRIGTRNSPLALWQANFVAQQLKLQNLDVELVPLLSHGEIDLVSPIYEIGIQGVFTKELDTALLNNQIDIAVHSLKDVPTKLAHGIEIIATPPRGNPWDVLVYRNSFPNATVQSTIATSSLRRSAQWKNKFPTHTTVPLRGNVQTRLNKILENNWDGAIFAAAGLERLNSLPNNSQFLKWMIPAPAQGAIGIAIHQSNEELATIVKKINDPITYQCTQLEREFLSSLGGICSLPIGCYVQLINDTFTLTACMLTTNGEQKSEVCCKVPFAKKLDLVPLAIYEILKKDGEEILKSIKQWIKKKI